MKLKVSELVAGLMLRSANDACLALAWSGDVIQGIIADDNTVYTMDWSIAPGPTTYVIRIGVS